MIGKNTEKSPVDTRRLAITQTPIKDHQLIFFVKNSRSKMMIIIGIVRFSRHDEDQC